MQAEGSSLCRTWCGRVWILTGRCAHNVSRLDYVSDGYKLLRVQVVPITIKRLLIPTSIFYNSSRKAKTTPIVLEQHIARLINTNMD